MKVFLLFLIPTICLAGFSDLGNGDLYDYQVEPKRKVSVKKKIFRKKNSKQSELIEKLLEEDKKLAEILKRQEKNVIIRRKGEKVIALTRVKGIVLNSILAMNVNYF